MKTYQDLLNVGANESDRKNFVRALINEHKSSKDYKIAADAYEYYCHRNVTISKYRKLLYKVTGEPVEDRFTANYKMATRHFHRFVIQEVQYLLGNGISWGEEGTEDKLGTKRRSFDRQVKDAAIKALWGKVAFGLFDNDHVEVFSYLEFVPLYDETNGALMAGVRFWQIDEKKPLRATLYEVDGFTKYAWSDDNSIADEPKRGYKVNIGTTEAGGVEIYNYENYPTFPIVPLWANGEHQSEIVGLREQIDAYDLIKSGFANTVDEASIFYWTINNAGGMDDIDLAKFVTQMKTIHAAVVDESGATAQSHTMEAPYQSREALLGRLEADMYKDAMALDTERIASGAVTATQIMAAYENLNAKCDDFEYQVLDFINGILAVAGVDDEATFTRSQIVNTTEMVQVLTQAGAYLDEKYVTEKILTLLGDADRVDEVLSDMEQSNIDRFTGGEPVEEEAE